MARALFVAHQDVAEARLVKQGVIDRQDRAAGIAEQVGHALIDQGAAEVSAYVTHGVLSGAACERVTNSVLKELVITDSIEPLPMVSGCAKVRHVSIAPLMGEAIRRIAHEESVSKLFD